VASKRPRGPRIGIEIDPAALRQARLDAGLSLAQIAGSDLTRQAVHLIESGKVRPTMRSLRIIAHRLGVAETALLAPPGPLPDELAIAELQDLCQRQEYAQVAEQALALVSAGGSPALVAFAHHYLGQALYELTRPAEALLHLREARDQFETIGNPWWVAESTDWEAMALHVLEDASALRVVRKALRRYRSLEPRQPETEARILEHQGAICSARHDYEGGRVSYEAALQVEGGVRELARIARIYHGLAGCHYHLNRLQPAAELLLKAVTLYEAEQRIAPRPMRRAMPAVENDLGLIAMQQGDVVRAEQLFLSALDHFAEVGTERWRNHVLLSLGELRQNQGRYDEALAFVTRALESAVALDETFTLVSGNRQLGKLHAERGDHDLADASFQRALSICHEAGLHERAKECMRSYQRVLADRRATRRRARTASA
jgi:tetratricopeptide (TPR) repeat protein